MKLKSIKLSGFKSFVDATTINFKSDLTGIVGPNGCGKSNIIDATRWVMGEISARQLRGATMRDVIFNGSAARSKVGKAAVELLFDNSDALFGGEYARYAEIALRREVTREGASDYYINNTPCRRKEIINLFLGTGLGDNSYAVIEQGTISQFIEAKPEEMRGFIEEAAGISKYKERRHETELRIKQTKDNLARLNDILTELSRELRHLRAQARTAERYTQLKAETRVLEAEIAVLKARALEAELANANQAIGDVAALMTDQNVQQQSLTAKLAAQKEQRNVAVAKYQDLQSKFYQEANRIAEIEQKIKYLTTEQENREAHKLQLTALQDKAASEREVLYRQIEKLSGEINRLKGDEVAAQGMVTECDQKLNEALTIEARENQVWEEYSQKLAKAMRECEIANERKQYTEQQFTRVKGEIETLHKELASYQTKEIESSIQDLTAEAAVLEELKVGFERELKVGETALSQLHEQIKQLETERHSERENLQQLRGRIASLEVLQQEALGDSDHETKAWLSKHLGSVNYLTQNLTVDSKWERAVEMVLSNDLKTVYVDDLANLATALEELKGEITLLEEAKEVPLGTLHRDFEPLNSKITGVRLAWLDGIYCVASFSEALKLRSQLAASESLITPDGVWIGPNWLRLRSRRNAGDGVIVRTRELKQLRTKVKSVESKIVDLDRKLQSLNTDVTQLNAKVANLRQELNLNLIKHGKIESELAAAHTKLAYISERVRVVLSNLDQQENSLKSLQKQLDDSNVRCLSLQNEYAVLNSESEKRVQARTMIQKQLQQKQQDAAAAKERAFAINSQLKLLATELNYAESNVQRLTVQLASFAEELEKLLSMVAGGVAEIPTLQGELGTLVDRHSNLERELHFADEQQKEAQCAIENLEKEIAALNLAMDSAKSNQTELKLKQQRLQVEESALHEKVAELQLEYATIEQNLPRDAILEEKQAILARNNLQISEIGPVNLAAVSECEKVLERKNFLDQQNQDLLKALQMLEDAIKKIDHDTKNAFREAYTKINERFKELFPKIFSGGSASLSLTSEDLLTAGVTIMAEPPGKRNASIHSLSGGEKALTTLALIFAFFHLTPAPFCILDEVDAPLDELNVSRFGKLIREMSEKVQFIFVTHNKATMEIANQLIGVTMKEAGVSRVVAVDLAEAERLAQK